MSDTRTLLAKIGALRQRLEQAQGLASEARSAAAALAEGPTLPLPLDAAVEEAGHIDEELAAAVRPLAVNTPPAAPKQLTARARRVLEKGRDLLERLREMAGTFEPPEQDGPDEAGPLRLHYSETVAMMDTALRTVGLLPESAAAQMHLCKGLEAVLSEVASRLRTLTAGGDRLRRQHAQIHSLAEALIALSSGQPFDVGMLHHLASEVLEEAADCEPLVFLWEPPDYMPGHVACHSLTTARVIARLARHDKELRGRAAEAVLAALVHDVGMLGVPPEILAIPGPLHGDARRTVEAHTVAGVQHLAGLFRDTPAILDAVATHHERLDGTGYPDGMKDAHHKPLSRLLAVSDTYAAMCVPRSHRPARSTRTALADTLLLAEQGQLDRHYASLLLKLSFYPVGSMVEMASGSVGVVVAAPAGEGTNPARPVVAVLTDDRGEPLARPRHLDLSQTDAHGIVRSLNPEERLDVMGRVRAA